MRINDLSLYNNKNHKLVNISDLKDGDVFRAEVMDIKQNEMVLKLMGADSIISAKTLKILGLKIGEFVNFKVTSNNNNQLMLEPMITSFQNAESEVIQNTIKNFKLPDNNISEDLIKKMFDNSLLLGKESLINFYNLLKENPDLDTKKLFILLKNNISVTEESINNLNSFINQNTHLNNQADELIKSLGSMNNLDITDTLADFILGKGLKNNIKINELVANNKEIFKSSNVDEFGINIEKLVTSISKSTNVSQNDFMIDLLNYIGKADENFDKSLIKEYIKRNASEILASLSNKLKVDLKNNNLDNITDSYKNIYKLTTSLMDSRSGLKETSENLFNNVSEIRQKIEFMNQILQYDTYLQIPLKLNQNEYMPELYVLKNKKHKQNASNITALLCLDLSKLGYTEVLINKNLNNISCKFRLEDFDSKETFVTYMNDLKLKLSSLGYNLISVSYENLDTKTNIINKSNLLPDEGKEDGKIHSFDIRV
ncbi:MAG TPA: hypothetical protein DCP90_07155 [Clostridiales bacterium]|nr:MAG: hypothetical protein A2Y22_02435 [Clostridiales bacterium GWD2_32_59]HAN10374.1 hypothetical protein [Clostridiales bacterium]